MTIEHTVENFIDMLAGEGRIMLIGGLAVIAHGLSRATKDADIWLEPFEDENIWAEKVNKICAQFERSVLFDVFENKAISSGQLATHVYEKKMIRINGLERNLDIFREPNNMEEEDFEQVFNHANKSYGKCKVMDEIDLLLTKEDTGRSHDIGDQVFLRAKINSGIQSSLENGSYQEVKTIFDRYIDMKSCESALKNPSPDVKELAYEMMKLIAENGDMFAKAALEARQNA